MGSFGEMVEEEIKRRLRATRGAESLGTHRGREVKGRKNSRHMAYGTSEFIYPLNVAVRRSLGTLAKVFSGK